MPRAPINFTVKGLAPDHDPTWHTATAKQKATYMRAVRELVLTEFDKQLAAGLDKDGIPLTPIKESTRRHRRSEMGPADPNAPPLTPAWGASRTRSLVDARVVRGEIQVFWRFDVKSGKRWGTILGYHRDGKGHLPERDVFGLSEEARQRVLQAAFNWWGGFVRGLPTAMPVRPRPGKAAVPAVAVRPRRVNVGAAPETSRTPADVTVGTHIYTGSKAAADILLNAAKAGRPIKFRSYE